MKSIKIKPVNPYLATLKVPAIKRYRKDAWQINSEGQKELLSFLVDKEQHYRGFISTSNNDIYKILSGNAHKMLNYIQNRSPVKNQYLFIKPDEYMKYDSIKSYKTFNSIVSELVKANILQRYEGKKYCYWYNPSYFNRGNRLIKYKDNIDMSW